MPSTPAGQRRHRIELQRDLGGEDDHGGKAEAWTHLAWERAKILWGPSAERRSAAQEQATQTATFRVLANDRTRAVKPSDRIAYAGIAWDIVGIATPDVSPAEIEFTAAAVRGA